VIVIPHLISHLIQNNPMEAENDIGVLDMRR
jgi:hypothetical protein